MKLIPGEGVDIGLQMFFRSVKRPKHTTGKPISNEVRKTHFESPCQLIQSPDKRTLSRWLKQFTRKKLVCLERVNLKSIARRMSALGLRRLTSNSGRQRCLPIDASLNSNYILRSV